MPLVCITILCIINFYVIESVLLICHILVPAHSLNVIEALESILILGRDGSCSLTLSFRIVSDLWFFILPHVLKTIWSSYKKKNLHWAFFVFFWNGIKLG